MKNPIPVSIQKVIQPLFGKLSYPAFLCDFSNTLTSNANESYHHVFWGLTPKQQYTSSEAIEMAVHLSVCLYNSGFYGVYSRMLARCKMTYLVSSLALFRCVDNRRIANRDYQGQDRVKYNQKKEWQPLSKQADVFVREEGTQYKQSAFQGKQN